MSVDPFGFEPLPPADDRPRLRLRWFLIALVVLVILVMVALSVTHG